MTKQVNLLPFLIISSTILASEFDFKLAVDHDHDNDDASLGSLEEWDESSHYSHHHHHRESSDSRTSSHLSRAHPYHDDSSVSFQEDEKHDDREPDTISS